MKKNIPTLLFLLVLTLMATAQPGGRPMGPPPGGSGQRPSRSEMERMKKEWGKLESQEKAMEMRQKRKVKEGDLFKVAGALQDSAKGEPIPYVNVAIYSASDTTMVKGTMTDGSGLFEFNNIPQGKMLLMVSAIGYGKRTIPFEVTNNTALGTIKLAPGSTVLKEVKVKAERPLFAMDGEKTIYNVSEDPTVQTGTTTDALQNAPGVEVDIEGNVTLRGVSSVEIWINDKPSRLEAENLKTYLETLPANALARIETITNPSAKYATSAEAVINIVTSAYIKSNHFISFGVNGATQPNVSPWLSYTWANTKLSVNIYTSYRFNISQNSGWSNTTYRRDNEEGEFDTTATESYNSQGSSRRHSGNIFANVTYTFDSMTDLHFFASAFLNSNPSLSTLQRSRAQFLTSDPLDAASYAYLDTNNNSGLNGFGMAGLEFTHKFDNEGHNIRASLHNHYSRGNSRNDFVRLFTSGDGQNYNKAYIDNNTTEELSADVRYNRPYSQDGEFSFGLDYGIKRMWKNYDVFDNQASGKQYDFLRTYSFDDTENEAGADVEWTRRWGNFTLELGLGGQYENVDFRYKGSPLYPFTNDDSVCNYFTANPSVHLTYRTESMHNFKVNYSLRMRRPDENDITTYKRYSLDSWSSGRREVTYAYTHSAEIGWSKFFMTFGNIGLEGYARYSANEVDNLTTSTEEDDPILNRIVQFSQPYNMGSSYRAGAMAHATIRPNGFFNIRLYANLYDYGYRLDQGAKGVLQNHKVSWSARLNCWVKLWNKFQVFASANYSSPTISLAAERKANYYLNCGVRADFFKRKLSAFINVQDIFNWGKTVGSGSITTNPYLLVESNSYTLNSRYISAGITLRFGKMELESRSQQGASDSE